MKKMFFTAVALVAFSFTSMANTIEIKEVVIPVEEKSEVLSNQENAFPTIDVCAIIAIATYLEMEEAGFPPSTCASEAQGANHACQTNQ